MAQGVITPALTPFLTPFITILVLENLAVRLPYGHADGIYTTMGMPIK